MDHGKSVYSVNGNKDNDVYTGYARTQCAQQSQTTQRQHFLPPYAMPVPISNNMPQQLMYNGQAQPMYNIMYGPQSMYRNQNTFPTNAAFTQPIESVPWVSEPCLPNAEVSTKDKYMKYENKLKDNSCCIARECPPLPDVYKTANKNFYYNKMDPQWFYGSNYDNQKYNELPSCSQIAQNSAVSECCSTKSNVKSVKYCSIQKYPEPDPKLYMYANKYDNHGDMYVNNKEYPSCSQLTQQCNIYSNATPSSCLEVEKKQCEINQNYYAQNQTLYDVPKIDDKIAEESTNAGGESDIVVEDSDEDSDDSDDVDKEELRPCLVCNLATVENHFYIITSKSLVTSFTQTIVSEKLTDIFGTVLNSSNHLCSACMSLINTLDNLESQLSNVKRDLVDKYKNTLQTLQIFIDKQNASDKIITETVDNKCGTVKVKKIGSFRSFKCRVCEKIFSLKKFYKYHMSKHKTKNRYLCERCGCNFVKHSNLLAHLQRHLNNFKSRCQFCKKRFSCERLLRQHKCLKTNLKSFICHICGRRFKSASHLKEHEHFCSGVLPYKCSKCVKCFPSSAKRNQHVKLKHDKVFSEVCGVCNKGFVKQSDLKAHMSSHSTEKRYKCSKCAKEYKSLSNLNQHSKVHNSKLPFVCNVCPKGFIRKENLEAHLNIHNGVKPFECSVCGKKFASQKNLDAHLKVHKGTTSKKSCKICGKQLAHGLEDHMRTHSSVKDFQCPLCDTKFVTKGALAKHKKRKHDNNVDLEII